MILKKFPVTITKRVNGKLTEIPQLYVCHYCGGQVPAEWAENFVDVTNVTDDVRKLPGWFEKLHMCSAAIAEMRSA